jgi:hypothetical protein
VTISFSRSTLFHRDIYLVNKGRDVIYSSDLRLDSWNGRDKLCIQSFGGETFENRHLEDLERVGRMALR